MRRRTRWQWWAEWAGLIVTAAVALIWFASRWHGAVLQLGERRNQIVVLIGRGMIIAGRTTMPRLRPSGFLYLPGGIADAEPAWNWGFEVDLHPRGGTSWSVGIPLWFPFLVAATATAWIWRLDRRRPPGACPKCHYDLTGNTTGICPECGAAKPTDRP